MGRGLSVYLDLVRLLASVLVVLYHFVGWPHFGVATNALNIWGHEAVIVFFVLSGFVIRHAAEIKDVTLHEFATSRLSRFYSVIIPCLVLTMAFDYFGRAIAPEIYAKVNIPDSAGMVFAKLYSTVFMLNESWVVKDFYSNVAYWSICYEFWFYVLFALCAYATPRQRLLGGLVVLVLVGPRILVMFPIWLIGTLAYTERTTAHWSRPLVWLAFVQPVIVFGAYVAFQLRDLGVELIGLDIASRLQHSGYLLTDTLLAASLAVHFAAAKRLDQPLLWALGWAERAIKFGAARSFTLYLLHVPTMFVVAAISTWLTGSPQLWLIVTATFCIPLLLGRMIEDQRFALRPLIRRVLARWLAPQVDIGVAK
jgi:peptidoglycan/LPS O-acetylase OafA/YrhL